MNEVDQAQQFFESALKHYPDFEEAQLGLATTLMAQQKPDLALPHLQRAVALDSQDEVCVVIACPRRIEPWVTRRSKRRLLAQFQRLRSQLASQQGTSTPGEVTRQVLQNGELQ